MAPSNFVEREANGVFDWRRGTTRDELIELINDFDLCGIKRRQWTLISTWSLYKGAETQMHRYGGVFYFTTAKTMQEGQEPVKWIRTDTLADAIKLHDSLAADLLSIFEIRDELQEQGGAPVLLDGAL